LVIETKPIPRAYNWRIPNTDPRTPGQWVRDVVFAVIPLFLLYVMLRIYVF
jgi:hypothetical protein